MQNSHAQVVLVLTVAAVWFQLSRQNRLAVSDSRWRRKRFRAHESRALLSCQTCRHDLGGRLKLRDLPFVWVAVSWFLDSGLGPDVSKKPQTRVRTLQIRNQSSALTSKKSRKMIEDPARRPEQGNDSFAIRLRVWSAVSCKVEARTSVS